MMLFHTASLHLPYESQTPTSVPLVGQGWAQVASLWASCLRVHRVGSSIGVVGSPPRHCFTQTEHIGRGEEAASWTSLPSSEGSSRELVAATRVDPAGFEPEEVGERRGRE